MIAMYCLRLSFDLPTLMGLDSDAGRRNLRYRAEGDNRWKWVTWKAPITGLRSGTTYEVEARVHSGEAWQPWMSATATTK